MTEARADRMVWLDASVDNGPVLHLAQTARVLRDYGCAATPDDLVGMSATDLRHALAAGADDDAGLLIVSDTPVEYITEDVVPSSGVEFDADADGLLIWVYVEIVEWVDRPGTDANVLRQRPRQTPPASSETIAKSNPDALSCLQLPI